METFTCRQCIHAGEPYIFDSHEIVECRIGAPGPQGFPIVNADSWCSPGKNVTEPLAPQSQKPDEKDYVTRNNGDGTMTTVHIPTLIMTLKDRVDDLELAVALLSK